MFYRMVRAPLDADDRLPPVVFLVGRPPAVDCPHPTRHAAGATVADMAAAVAPYERPVAVLVDAGGPPDVLRRATHFAYVCRAPLVGVFGRDAARWSPPRAAAARALFTLAVAVDPEVGAAAGCPTAAPTFWAAVDAAPRHPPKEALC